MKMLPRTSCSRIRAPSELPVSASARSEVTASTTLVRSMKSRTSSGWLSSACSTRYSATPRSSPVKSRMKSAAPCESASDSAASLRPAAQPSVRRTSAATSASASSTPARVNSSAASGSVNARSAPRSSFSRPDMRRRCSDSTGSARLAMISRSPGRRVPQQRIDLAGGRGALQVMEIVEHDPHRCRGRVQEVAERGHEVGLIAAERTQLASEPGLAGCLDRPGHRGPETRRVPVLGLERDPAGGPIVVGASAQLPSRLVLPEPGGPVTTVSGSCEPRSRRSSNRSRRTS